jgi:hypothetical protein
MRPLRRYAAYRAHLLLVHASWQPADLTARAETGLSCSHNGCTNVPRPLRRRVLRGCISKSFTSSVAFALCAQARLPVASLRRKLHDAAGFVSYCGPLACTLPWRARPHASTPRSPCTSVGCYKGDLAPPLAGLPPASRCGLTGRARGEFSLDLDDLVRFGQIGLQACILAAQSCHLLVAWIGRWTSWCRTQRLQGALVTLLAPLGDQ